MNPVDATVGRPPRSLRPILAAAIAAAAAYVSAFAVAARSSDYSRVGAWVVVPTVVLLGGAAAAALARRETDARIRRIILGSFALKVMATFVMYGITFVVYGSGDAQGYHVAGTAVAAAIWDGGTVPGLFSATGTRFVQHLTGLVYVLTGPTRLGGFLVFSLMGWGGLYLFYRALPDTIRGTQRRTYAALVFFLPSLVLWPSTIGKEPWMMLTLGAAAFGASRLLAHRSGIAWLATGLIGMTIVRPHMAVLTLAAIAGALTTARLGASRGTRLGSRVVIVAAMVVAGALVATQVQQFFGLESLGLTSIEQVFEQTNAQTSLGGSQFTNAAVRSPAALPLAFVSVVFRPFPFEARTATAFVASLEGVFLALLMWRHRRALWRLPRAVRDNPYTGFAAAYSVGFIIAFSNFNNFGLLARERTQLFPLLLVLLIGTVAGTGSAAPDGTDHANGPTTPTRAQPGRLPT